MKKILRKIHLWLSVPFGIFITLICFAGSTLVFEKEISEMCRPSLYFVEAPNQQPLPLDELMQQVSRSLPDSVEATGITAYPERDRAWLVSLSKPRRASLYVNPYTGEVTGRNEKLPFFDTMFHLHRWLLGSSSGFGKVWVGVSTLLLVVILLTGILMWLTNRHKPLTASLKISFTKGWPRFWHDLHVAGGIYATLFLLALSLTGLTWSFSWYRNGFYRLFGAEATAQESHGNSDAADPAKSSGSTHGGERNGNPNSERNGERGERGGRSGRGEHRKAEPYAHWQTVYKELADTHKGYQQITLAEGKATLVPEGRRSLRAGDVYSFHPRTGEITDVKMYDLEAPTAKLRSLVYRIHTGSWGGWLTRWLTFLSALLGATLPLTGYYLWLRKKGKKHPDPAVRQPDPR
ncbi:MAG: PepSY-associated TM helix domain-containing protein [Parabacteroides sp.]